MIVAGIALIAPGWPSNFLGAGMAAVFFAYHWFLRSRQGKQDGVENVDAAPAG
jgi:hypothetical protein